MSIRYKLFGIPKTFNEFVDKITKKGNNQVDVILTDYNDEESLDGIFDHHYLMGIQAGKTKLLIKEFSYLESENLYTNKLNKYNLKRDFLKEAVKTAEKLQYFSLEATINGFSINGTKEKIDEYDKKIAGMEQKYKNYIQNKLHSKFKDDR